MFKSLNVFIINDEIQNNTYDTITGYENRLY